MRLPRAGSLSGLCLSEQRVLSCEDSESDERVDRGACRRVGARSMVVVPLRHDGAALAVLEVISPQAYAFSESDVDTLELLANLMGAAIAHADDYARVAQANEQLRELDRLKDGFVATVSHELRTPLASIIAYTEMLADGDAGALNGQQERMVSAVERNSRRLLGLIENLLTINQIEAGALTTRLVPTELRPVVEAVGEALRPAAEAASVELRVEVSEGVGMLLADAAQLDRALMNVVANAIKFSLPGGTVDLAARRAGGRLEVEVTDRGIGIAREDQERMFERFFRAASAQERAIPGSGLGLGIVKEIIERHGGEIALTSALGEGTRVTIHLPVDAAALGTADAPSAHRRGVMTA
jgi:signal transduction histidine kinase